MTTCTGACPADHPAARGAGVCGDPTQGCFDESEYRTLQRAAQYSSLRAPALLSAAAAAHRHGDTQRALEALHPLGHLGEPDDIAYGILYLASDESKFMTGAELVIDGGYTAQ